jgi:hypothetical protein
MELAELAFLADQAFTEALIAAQVEADSDSIQKGSPLQIFNDHGFAVIVSPDEPYAHTVTLRHISGAEDERTGPDVDQLLWGFLGIDTVLEGQTHNPEAP